MKGPEYMLLEDAKGEFLAAEDMDLCRKMVGHFVQDRNPACLLAGTRPLLQRYYGRLVARVMRGAGHIVHLCPPLLHGDIPAFLTRVSDGMTVEEGIAAASDVRTLLVFMQASRIRPEELILLREMQRSFGGLGLCYLYIGAAELLLDSMTAVLVLDDALDGVRKNAASACTLSAGPAAARRLERMLR